MSNLPSPSMSPNWGRNSPRLHPYGIRADGSVSSNHVGSAYTGREFVPTLRWTDKRSPTPTSMSIFPSASKSAKCGKSLARWTDPSQMISPESNKNGTVSPDNEPCECDRLVLLNKIKRSASEARSPISRICAIPIPSLSLGFTTIFHKTTPKTLHRPRHKRATPAPTPSTPGDCVRSSVHGTCPGRRALVPA